MVSVVGNEPTPQIPEPRFLGIAISTLIGWAISALVGAVTLGVFTGRMNAFMDTSVDKTEFQILRVQRQYDSDRIDENEKRLKDVEKAIQDFKLMQSNQENILRRIERKLDLQ